MTSVSGKLKVQLSFILYIVFATLPVAKSVAAMTMGRTDNDKRTLRFKNQNTCYKALQDADANSDTRVNANEFVSFCCILDESICHLQDKSDSFQEMPLALISAFYAAACLCDMPLYAESFVVEDGGCCIGDAAQVRLVFDDMQYMTKICSFFLSALQDTQNRSETFKKTSLRPRSEVFESRELSFFPSLAPEMSKLFYQPTDAPSLIYRQATLAPTQPKVSDYRIANGNIYGFVICGAITFVTLLVVVCGWQRQFLRNHQTQHPQGTSEGIAPMTSEPDELYTETEAVPSDQLPKGFVNGCHVVDKVMTHSGDGKLHFIATEIDQVVGLSAHLRDENNNSFNCAEPHVGSLDVFGQSFFCGMFDDNDRLVVASPGSLLSSSQRSLTTRRSISEKRTERSISVAYKIDKENIELASPADRFASTQTAFSNPSPLVSKSNILKNQITTETEAMSQPLNSEYSNDNFETGQKGELLLQNSLNKLRYSIESEEGLSNIENNSNVEKEDGTECFVAQSWSQPCINKKSSKQKLSVTKSPVAGPASTVNTGGEEITVTYTDHLLSDRAIDEAGSEEERTMDGMLANQSRISQSELKVDDASFRSTGTPTNYPDGNEFYTSGSPRGSIREDESAQPFFASFITDESKVSHHSSEHTLTGTKLLEAKGLTLSDLTEDGTDKALDISVSGGLSIGSVSSQHTLNGISPRLW